MRKEDSKKRKEGRKDQYLERLKKYKNMGVTILIDGEELPEIDWEKLFDIREDDKFYMADYIPDLGTGRLQEIRFDRVYNR